MSSFAFSFDLDEADETSVLPSRPASDFSPQNLASCLPASLVELTLDQLIEALPPSLSATQHSLHGGHDIYRRDLFDARFQRVSEDTAENEVWSNAADLIKGVYEGGAATWECASDLVTALLDRGKKACDITGRQVLEIGCGTAVPTMWLLQEFFRTRLKKKGDSKRKTVVILQDYNDEVLLSMTFPNVLIAFARANEELGIADDHLSASLEISDELLQSFREFLSVQELDLRFMAGDWSAWPPASLKSQSFDLVLSSETVYEVASLPAFVHVLQTSSAPDSTCLVALKRVYFGVGGGEYELKKVLERVKATVQEAWQGGGNVKRVILEIGFKPADPV